MLEGIQPRSLQDMRRNIWRILSYSVLLGVLSGAAIAGERSARPITIEGKVVDILGRPVKGVRVTLRNSSGVAIGDGVTNDVGTYNFRVTTAGSYLVVVKKDGFRRSVRTVLVSKAGSSTAAIVMESEQPLIMSVRAARLRAQNDLSLTGASKYTFTDRDITNLPAGKYTPLNQVMLQMPGVTLDQNQEIHIRGEHLGIQYQMNGILLPLNINTDPTFTQLLNSFFIKKVSLLDGILPARYGYRTAGVIDIVTKDGCEQQGGDFSILGGQRNTVSPSFELGGCKGNFGYYVTGLYLHNNIGFSNATSDPNPIHDVMNQGQGFGNFTYQLGPAARLSLMTGFTVNDGQFPNSPGMPALYQLDDINPVNYPSTAINSSLEQQDYFGVLALNAAPAADLDFQLAYAIHYNSESFNPDLIGDLIYQGVASRVFNSDLSNSLQGDLSYQPLESHALRFGFYMGEYGIEVDDSSLVFPVDAQGQQLQTTPISVGSNLNRIIFVGGVYAEDTWHITDKLGVNFGPRWDILSGLSNGSQVSPRINFFYQWRPGTTLHAGFASYFQIPNFQATSPGVFSVFKGTSGAVGVGGNPFAVPERDFYWDAGFVHRLSPNLKLEQDNYLRLDRNYLDEGQFGFVPIEAPLNYSRGYGWGTENSVSYNSENLSARLNFTMAREEDTGVDTSQFNFEPAALAYIDSHSFVLDHTSMFAVTVGLAYHWRDWLFSMDNLFNTGVRAGFANTQNLPNVWQVNVSAARQLTVPWLGQITNRVTLVNIFDRVNLIRPANGIGVFQAAYGPRLTVYNTLTIPLPR
ncbi:MAG: TonB-dependent receptor [Deltaproteobacteria bacterium]|nr:TonB-dependent receptor [Deltaproteobacteria bacterium]